MFKLHSIFLMKFNHRGEEYNNVVKELEKFREMDNNHQRLLFALASYNVGYGHIRDAQKIAEAQGLDKNKWTSLKQTLPLLAKRKYYKKTKYGYARGREPVKYIENILIYYDILKQKPNA